jgi:hypothetical protein
MNKQDFINYELWRLGLGLKIGLIIGAVVLFVWIVYSIFPADKNEKKN